MDHFSVATSESENQVKGRLLLDVVVGEGSTVFELLSSEDESLLIWWNTSLHENKFDHAFNKTLSTLIKSDDKDIPAH